MKPVRLFRLVTGEEVLAMTPGKSDEGVWTLEFPVVILTTEEGTAIPPLSMYLGGAVVHIHERHILFVEAPGQGLAAHYINSLTDKPGIIVPDKPGLILPGQ